MALRLERWLLRSSCVRQPWICNNCRSLTTSSTLLSGHNRWSTIRHDKGKNDAAKSKERQLISKEIIFASKSFGPGPKSNPRLALAIANAKKVNMHKATIEAAIARGQGVSVTGAVLEPVTIEAILPPSVAVVIECMTDQKARTLQDIRFLIKDAGGTATPTSYLFERKGKIVFASKEGLNVDEYLEPAIDAGAIDVDTDGDGKLIVFTEHTATKGVASKLSEITGLEVESSEIIWDPNKDTMVTLDPEALQGLESVLNTIREDSSVQDIYANFTSI